MAKFPTDATVYFSNVANDFHKSYKDDANRQERIRVWLGYFDLFTTNAAFGYDLGCGSGILACELARRGIEMIGVDGAPNMLAIARACAREQQLSNISFQQHRLPISDTSTFRLADVIISSSALEYLDSIREALGCVHRLLRPGGLVIFSVSNHDSLSRKVVRAVHWATGKPEYLGLLKQFKTVDALRNDLRSTGFTYLDHSYFGKADRLNRMFGVILPERFASNMIIVAAQRN